MLKDNEPQPQDSRPEPVEPAKKPNEQASFHISGSLKITDPETGEVLVKMRAD